VTKVSNIWQSARNIIVERFGPLLVPRVALTAVSKSRNEGQITISQCLERSTNGRKLSKKDVVPAGSLYIFQFPTIKGVRMTSTPVN
jgi:hypothetical protein